jgi:hypothetical protein
MPDYLGHSAIGGVFLANGQDLLAIATTLEPPTTAAGAPSPVYPLLTRIDRLAWRGSWRGGMRGPRWRAIPRPAACPSAADRGTVAQMNPTEGVSRRLVWGSP